MRVNADHQAAAVLRDHFRCPQSVQRARNTINEPRLGRPTNDYVFHERRRNTPAFNKGSFREAAWHHALHSMLRIKALADFRIFSSTDNFLGVLCP
jgi:hypothetical protein